MAQLAKRLKLSSGSNEKGSRRPGWQIVAGKEFGDQLLSVRFYILLAILGLATIGAVYAVAGNIREVAEEASEAPSLFLKLFTVEPDLIPPFITMVALLGPILGIALAFDSVNSERSQGTLPRLLAQPIYRDDVINGKFVAGLSTIAVMLTSIALVLAGVGMFRLGIVPTGREVARLVAWLIVTCVYIGFWLALSTFFSVWLRRAATSALAAIASWLIATLFGGLLVGLVASAIAPVPPQDPTPEEQLRYAKVRQSLSRVFPNNLYGEATTVLLRPEVNTLDYTALFRQQQEPRALPDAELSIDQSLLVVWPQVTALVALTILCFGGAYVLFMRQEIRA